MIEMKADFPLRGRVIVALPFLCTFLTVIATLLSYLGVKISR
jgi:hypothetical protein